MAFEKVFSNAEFTLFYLGEGGGVYAGGNFGGHYSRGGHLFQVEPVAIATQTNALIFEAPRDIATRAGGFEINFKPSALVYQDKGPLHDQGEFSENGKIEVFDGGDQPAAILERLRGASPNFLISENGALWHEARIYQLDKTGGVYCFYVLGYVPAGDISRACTHEKIMPVDFFRRDW